MSTTPAPKPKIGNITKFFIPGLAIGLVVGAIGGAYYAPAMEQTVTMPEHLNKPIVRNAPAPADHPEPGATGQTGSTGETPAAPAPGGAPK